MPHVILEYSANLPTLPDFSPLFAEIHQVLQRIGGIKLENCKSRAREAEYFYIGDGSAGNAFVHLSVEFLRGRSTEVKQAIGEACLDLLKAYYSAGQSDALQITVKIDDIALDFYFKHPGGSLNYR